MITDEMKYFVRRTDSRLESIEAKIDQFSEFKANLLGSAKVTAIIVSGVCGFISMLVCGILTYLITTHFLKGA